LRVFIGILSNLVRLNTLTDTISLKNIKVQGDPKK